MGPNPSGLRSGGGSTTVGLGTSQSSMSGLTSERNGSTVGMGAKHNSVQTSTVTPEDSSQCEICGGIGVDQTGDRCCCSGDIPFIRRRTRPGQEAEAVALVSEEMLDDFSGRSTPMSLSTSGRGSDADLTSLISPR